MARLDRSSEGEIYFDGESLADMNLDEYRRDSISMIFQAFPTLLLVECPGTCKFSLGV